MRTAVILALVVVATACGSVAAKCTSDYECQSTGDSGAYCRASGMCHCDLVFYKTGAKGLCEQVLCKHDSDCQSNGDRTAYCSVLATGGNGACRCGEGYINQPTVGQCSKADDAVAEALLEGLLEEAMIEAASESAADADAGGDAVGYKYASQAAQSGGEGAFREEGDDRDNDINNGRSIFEEGVPVQSTSPPARAGECISDDQCRQSGDASAWCKPSGVCRCDPIEYTVDTATGLCKLRPMKGTCTVDAQCQASGDATAYCKTDSGFCRCDAAFEIDTRGLCVPRQQHTGTCQTDANCQATGDKTAYCNAGTGQCHCDAPNYAANSKGLCQPASPAPSAPPTFLLISGAPSIPNPVATPTAGGCSTDVDCMALGDINASCSREGECRCTAATHVATHDRATCTPRAGLPEDPMARFADTLCDTDVDCQEFGDITASCGIDGRCACNEYVFLASGKHCLPIVPRYNPAATWDLCDADTDCMEHGDIYGSCGRDGRCQCNARTHEARGPHCLPKACSATCMTYGDGEASCDAHGMCLCSEGFMQAISNDGHSICVGEHPRAAVDSIGGDDIDVIAARPGVCMRDEDCTAGGYEHACDVATGLCDCGDGFRVTEHGLCRAAGCDTHAQCSAAGDKWASCGSDRTCQCSHAWRAVHFGSLCVRAYV